MNGNRFDTNIALHSAAPGPVALCAALDIPVAGSASDAAAPEWVHLLPAGEIRTGDGRGPYRVADAVALMAASLDQGDRLPIDENHATDLAAPRGEPAPARGWIVELQSRDDGVWGRVEWTARGRRLVAAREYRGISPVIHHTKSGEVTAILRASLVNRPNLRGLTALHSLSSPPGHPALHTSWETQNMTLLEKLLAALGLPAATTETDAIAAVTALHQQQAASSTALQAARDEVLGPIAQKLGLQAGADAAAVLAGVEQLAAGAGQDGAVAALQAELAGVTTQLNTLLETGRREKAEAFVDGAIRAGRVGVRPMRDRYVTMHMADPAGTAEIVNALPVLGGGGQVVPATPPAREGEIALNAEQLAVARMLGQDPKAYAETLGAERAGEAAL